MQFDILRFDWYFHYSGSFTSTMCVTDQTKFLARALILKAITTCAKNRSGPRDYLNTIKHNIQLNQQRTTISNLSDNRNIRGVIPDFNYTS